jgi:hypothetical protein
MSCQFHVPAVLHLETRLRATEFEAWVDPIVGVNALKKKKKSLALLGYQTPIPRWASQQPGHNTKYIIPALIALCGKCHFREQFADYRR